jgi:hypothetical protein
VPQLSHSVRQGRDRSQVDASVQGEPRLINGRYGEIERRILTLFAEEPSIDVIGMPLASDIALLHLIKDGLFVRGFDRSVRSG